MPNASEYIPALKYGSNLDVNVDLADIRDANNNELLELDTVASAVNYVRIANSATGNNPVFSGQGDDTNVGVQLTAKGTAIVEVGTATASTLTQAAGGVLSVTSNVQRGRLTVPQLGIINGSAVTIDLTNNLITPGRYVIAQLGDKAAEVGTPYVSRVTSGAGSATIILSSSGGPAIDGTVDVQFIVV